jgi:hypothetical protein
MKKIISIAFAAIISSSLAMAENGINLGLSVTGGLFEVDGAKEKVTSGNTRTATATQDAEALVAIGSIFIEKELNDKLTIGIDYVPHSLASETAENDQSGGAGTTVNKVQVDFEDMTSVYAALNLSENVYAKLGYLQVEAITNETLATGGKYGDTTLDGFVVGLGYERDLDSGAFLRVEANYSELDGATLKNTVDNSKEVSVDGISGMGAKISVGRSF